MNPAAEYKGFERRRYPRLPVHWELKYKIIGRGLETKTKIIIKDVSVSGILFETDKPMPIATLLEIELVMELPGSCAHPIKATAEVTRQYKIAETGNYDMGLRFVNIDDANITRIRDYIKSLRR